MKKKIIGIFVSMLLIATTSLPVAGNLYEFTNLDNTSNAPQDMGIEWISFNKIEKINSPEFTIISQNENDIIFEIDFSGFFSREIEVEGIRYKKNSIQGGGFIAEIGKPEMPTYIRSFAIPQGAEAHTTIIDSQYISFNNYLIYPAQEHLTDQDELKPEFKINESFYNVDEFYPNVIFTITSPQDMRGVQISRLIIFPQTFNPVSKELRCYTKIKGKISFEKGNRIFCDIEKRSPFFDAFYQNILINYKSLRECTYSKSCGNGANLLIITHDNFYTSILPLAN